MVTGVRLGVYAYLGNRPTSFQTTNILLYWVLRGVVAGAIRWHAQNAHEHSDSLAKAFACVTINRSISVSSGYIQRLDVPPPDPDLYVIVRLCD